MEKHASLWNAPVTTMSQLPAELSQAGFFVSAVNPHIIRNFQGHDNPLRKVKTDKADSVKIARYTLDSWANLKQYTLMDELRSQLKTMNRQFELLHEAQNCHEKQLDRADRSDLSRCQHLL